jgi:hypothetical protein
MRRGEGQFICAEVNLRNRPDVGRLARGLGVNRHEAVGLLVAWREFVLTCGSSTGVLRGFDQEDVASFLDWPGKTSKLVGALKEGGFLGTKRRQLFYPHWLDTPTGDYAHVRAQQREDDRRRKADRRREERDGGDGRPEDVPGTSGGSPPDIHPESGDQSRKDVHRTPPDPPGRGGDVAAARLEWFEDNYPKGIVKREWCAAILGRLTQAEWEHLQYALGRQGGSIRWREKGRAPLPERWLGDLEWKRTKRPGPASNGARPRKAERRPEEPSPEDLERMRLAFVKRADIKQRLLAEGVPRSELEDRLEQELVKEAAELVAPAPASMAS